MTTKIASTEADYDPLCPHCEETLVEVYWRRSKVFAKWEYVSSFLVCKKVIGVSATD